mmetsp:Transcript_13384/g.43616  ORF Transcript_13384/g.43616 Transcript_13384/m.43616 type:complete len:571 (-) Transcript_13384:998-2710(-)|eukprot:CAMPEP_0118899276 /NCGR_PEP_ID=MMETSP1166-20130328/5902_1 /TAXON_ID=1104430 /ORGANISM="Chrysoreinhardia sp, Strain CCMP3193" /LENGTH=570 /DNA_ID=CAMNT_0006838401 /DNA_START=80 /DNA_END=1792 /DNA_ORIENTATION=+
MGSGLLKKTVLVPLAVVVASSKEGLTTKDDVVMIIADDLRPELSGFGCAAPTPRLDELMRDDHAVTFTQAYAQIALCAPSRNSFLSGRLPTTTESWQFLTDFRDVGPEWTALPEAFRKNGYETVGVGKVYHPGLPEDWDPPSWDPRMYDGEWEEWFYPKEPRCDDGATWCAVESNRTEDFEDTQIVEHTQKLLANVSSPFFLAVGFRKPHLQWRFPAQFLVDDHAVTPATFDVFPKNAPPLAFHMPYSEFSSFSDVDSCGGAAAMRPDEPYPPECQSSWRRGYYSAVAFLDEQIGHILDLTSSKSKNNDNNENKNDQQLVVFFGDHGWHLGEQAEWEKFTCFENALRVPLILKHPSLLNAVHDAPVELVGLYPTMARLASLDLDFLNSETAAPLDGTDFFEASIDAEYARSMFPRCVGGENYNDDYARNASYPDWYLNDCNDVPSSLFTHMGYTLRDSHWRFTAWFEWNGTALEPANGGLDAARPVATELYDHQNDDGSCDAPNAFDDFETINLADYSQYTPIVLRFRDALPLQFQRRTPSPPSLFRGEDNAAAAKTTTDHREDPAAVAL